MSPGRKLSTFDVAEMLQVDPGSVANWVDGGLLKAHRTPGGHRRVVAEDLVEFLKAHGMPVPAELQTTPVRVVIVDDEPPVTRMIAKLIATRHPEFEVTEAHDGFRAGTLVATLRPDVVILDLRMPGMDGFEVSRLIKSQEGTRGATVIAVTAYSSAESTQQAMECGVKLCLPKPLDLEQLIAEIETAVAEGRG